MKEAWEQNLLTGAVIVFVTVVVTWCWLKRNVLVARLKTVDAADWWLSVGEFVFTAVAGAGAAHFKVWDRYSWSEAGYTTIRVAIVSLMLAFLAMFAKWLQNRVKERAQEKIAQLSAELTRVDLRLSRFRRLGTQIRGLIDRKILRVREVAKKQVTSVADLIVQPDREMQVHTIIKATFEFFYFELQQKRPEGRMRLALYTPDETGSRLTLAYAFDGQQTSCFKANEDWMQLNSPQGTRSEVVRAYHSNGDHNLHLVPDCVSHPGFAWFRPEQTGYLRSMLTFKYQLQIEGELSALILALDCDEPNFFSPDRYEEISEFLIEMLRRFEYELLGLEIVAKLPPQA